MVFGAQITPDAYIPLLARIAEQRYACFIPNLSFNMAALEPKAADEIISAHPEIRSWILAGHSMGGLTASGYADDHRDTVDGLILLAAYTNQCHEFRYCPLRVISQIFDTGAALNQGFSTLFYRRFLSSVLSPIFYRCYPQKGAIT